jgi:hypothetical protein
VREKCVVKIGIAGIKGTGIKGTGIFLTTGDEFAMFTTGGRRMIMRGSPDTVPVTPAQAEALSAQGWRWSAHTHPDGGSKGQVFFLPQAMSSRCSQQVAAE